LPGNVDGAADEASRPQGFGEGGWWAAGAGEGSAALGAAAPCGIGAREPPKGFPCAGIEAWGEVMVERHCGQGPETPAISAGTVSRVPQLWQLK